MMADGWKNLPHHILLQIFQQSSIDTIGTSAQVCHSWNSATQDPLLWRSMKLFLDDRKLEESARRCKGLATKCRDDVTELRVECFVSGEEMNDYLKTLEDILKILWRSKLRVLELQGLYPDSPTSTAMRRFASFMNKFLKEQKNLENFSLKDTNFEDKFVTKFLEILGKSSGEKIKVICLINSYNNYDYDDLPYGPIHAFDTVLTKFTNLQSLTIEYLSEELLQNLSKSLGTNFKYFFITVSYLEESISGMAWRALKESCPDLMVSLNVSNRIDCVLLSPHIPLISITVGINVQYGPGGQFSLDNIATLYHHTLEELHIGHHLERDLTEEFLAPLETFQKLRTFSMSMTIRTEKNIQFLRAFKEIVKRQNTLRDVRFMFRHRRTISARLLQEIDSVKEDLKEFVDRGLVLKLILATKHEEMGQFFDVDTNTISHG
ncbi:F-box/LRR-repeat protein 21-like [Physella acuta]|uniref:F-box/LRR-repeat protein 21-like n=1 Tax=Physella acuta TaxID=109671 RepID=UPI0027DBD566|nr:F-box/LRR-repeat protein 21-like [Physella acuta]